MNLRRWLIAGVGVIAATGLVWAQARPGGADAVEEAQSPRPAAGKRPELEKSQHDRTLPKPRPSSGAFGDQPDHGAQTGFDSYKDTNNAARPNEELDSIRKSDEAARSSIR